MSAPHFEFIRRRRLHLGWVMAGLGLTALLLAGLDARQALEQQRATAQQTAAAQHRLQRLQSRRIRAAGPSPSISPGLEKQVNALAPVVAHLNLPWPDWLVAIRAATSNNIALLKLALSTENASVTVNGEAKSLADITAFTQQLATNPLVTSVSLQEHHLLESVPGTPVAFQADVIFSDGKSVAR